MATFVIIVVLTAAFIVVMYRIRKKLLMARHEKHYASLDGTAWCKCGNKWPCPLAKGK